MMIEIASGVVLLKEHISGVVVTRDKVFCEAFNVSVLVMGRTVANWSFKTIDHGKEEDLDRGVAALERAHRAALALQTELLAKVQDSE